jgi:hypothetical protein
MFPPCENILDMIRMIRIIQRCRSHHQMEVSSRLLLKNHWKHLDHIIFLGDISSTGMPPQKLARRLSGAS